MNKQTGGSNPCHCSIVSGVPQGLAHRRVRSNTRNIFPNSHDIPRHGVHYDGVTGGSDRVRQLDIQRMLDLTAGAGVGSNLELLEQIVTSKNESAFAQLMHRHGAMVLGVCRRILRHTQDAEDACQATFLVLDQRAAVIEKRASLSS